MDLSATTSNFNFQEMLSAINKLSSFPYSKQISGIRMSVDFYEKIKNNLTVINEKDRIYEEFFFGTPIYVDPDLEKDYEFCYEEVSRFE